MEEKEDIIFYCFIIFIKDDGTLTDKEILNGLGYPKHKILKNTSNYFDNNIQIARFNGWIYIGDRVLQTWSRKETWKFMIELTKKYEVIHCTLNDTVDGGLFVYHKDGQLIRLLDCSEKWSTGEMEISESIGKSFPKEDTFIKNDHSFWLYRIAEQLGVDIKKFNKNFIIYDDLMEDENAYNEKYNSSSNAKFSHHRYNPYDYYKK